MPRKQSKPTDRWAELLQREVAHQDSPPKDGVTFKQLAEMRRNSGLPYGWNSVYGWIRNEISAGRLNRTDMIAKEKGGRKVRRVYYTIA